MKCTSCYPLSKGNCFNADLLVSTVSYEHAQMQNQVSTNLTSSEEFMTAQIQTDINDESLRFVEKKTIEAFGATLTNSDDFDPNDMWVSIWERLVKLRCQLYVLPGGAIGRRVVSIYAQEVSLFGQGLQKTEKLMCFLPLMLNKVKYIKKNSRH